MQLYHHPYSLDSQKVRLALEEKARLPVFQNGTHIIFRTMDIMQYIDRLIVASTEDDPTAIISRGVIDWMEKIDGWNPKTFTLSHVPDKYRLFVSRFIRRVIIARMAEAPELASVYHVKLRDAYETEDKLKNAEIVKQSKEKLARLLDDAELQLNRTPYLAGEDFTMADSMFIPVLARITLLDLEEEYINCRPRIAAYYKLVKRRPSYKVVIYREVFLRMEEI